jgi:hypothetical protein
MIIIHTTFGLQRPRVPIDVTKSENGLLNIDTRKKRRRKGKKKKRKLWQTIIDRRATVIAPHDSKWRSGIVLVLLRLYLRLFLSSFWLLQRDAQCFEENDPPAIPTNEHIRLRMP